MDVVIGSAGFIGSHVADRIKHDKLAIPTSSSGYGGGSYWKNCEGIELYLENHDIDTVYLCAGRTGGVGRMAKDPFSFVLPNVRIHMNVFEACRKLNVKRVVCVQSTTGYPDSSEPMKEDDYDKGDLHPKYFAPGTAHRFIYNLARMFPFDTLFFRPSNVYGPRNNFEPDFSHVIEATVRKVSERQDPFVVWGDGSETRDAIYIDDLVDAMLMNLPAGAYNVGSGEEMSVNGIIDTLCDYAEFEPKIEYDTSKPTAIKARRVDCAKLRGYGWKPKVTMKKGLQKTYDWYQTKLPKG
jgi:GDP-L-fucose synthase